MKRARFSEEQIVGILKEHQAGRKLAEIGPRALCKRSYGCMVGRVSPGGGSGRSATAEKSGR
jgi:hypothetical protein